MKKLTTLLAVVGIAFTSYVSALDFSIDDDVRYVKDLKVTPINASTPAGLKKFAGRWAGKYNGIMSVVYTFENVNDPNNVSVVHSTAITPEYNVMKKLTARPMAPCTYDSAKDELFCQFEADKTLLMKVAKNEAGQLELNSTFACPACGWTSIGVLNRVEDIAGQPSGSPVQ